MADWPDIQFAIGFFHMTDTTQQPAPPADLIVPDFAGLRRLATVGAAIAPLAELVENMAWAEELGQPLDKEHLKRMTRSACAVMARTSLFSSNCSRMLNRLPLMHEPVFGFGANRTVTKNVIRSAWTSVTHAVQMAPDLLAEPDVCDTLRAAFGTRSQHLMSALDLRCYSLMLGQLSGAAGKHFVANTHTQNLVSHMQSWAKHISKQKPDIGAMPTALYPSRLEMKARFVAQALSDRCLGERRA